jgi:hypothetical protein
VRFLKFHRNSSREKSERAESVCEREGMNKFASARVCVWCLFFVKITYAQRTTTTRRFGKKKREERRRKKNDKNN